MPLHNLEDTAICTYVALIQGGVAAAWVGLVVMGLGVGAMAGASGQLGLPRNVR